MTVRAAVLTATITAGLAVVAATQLHVGDATPTTTEPTTQEFRRELAKTRRQLDVRTARAYRAGYIRAKRETVRRPDVQEALSLAAFVYQVPRGTLERLAFCESRMNPLARNQSSGASGLLQFLPSTWAGNHYGRAGFSVWSPYANALGAAHHIRRYGTGAWECR